MDYEFPDDKPKYTAEKIREARLAIIAYAFKYLASSPDNPKTREIASKILLSDPIDLLDTIEAQKNPIEF